MKKIIYYSGLLIAGAVLLSGCNNQIPEMTEEEKAMVVNYAADIVQRYDSNHPAKLQTLTPEPEASMPEEPSDETSLPDETKEEQIPDGSQEPEASEVPGKENEVIDNTDESTEVTLDDFLQLEKFHFSYEGYEITEEYPDFETESYFAMSATTPDHTLLVLKFSANNQSQTEETLDMIQKKVRFKMEINGEVKNALTTMLLNDFANYQDVIAAGDTVELVVICEIPKEQEGNIESLGLIVKNEDETATISLH